MEDDKFDCPRCGHEVTLEYREDVTYHGDGSGIPEVTYEATLVECECDIEYAHVPDEGVGIKEIIEDAGYQLNDKGYLHGSDGPTDYVTAEFINKQYADPDHLVDVFIKGRRTPGTKPFELWNGVKIDPTLDTNELRSHETRIRIEAPTVGDTFHDQYSFWIHVVDIHPGGRITVMEANPPCTLPADGKIKVFNNQDEFETYVAYNNIPGYWVDFSKNVNVKDWLTEYLYKQFISKPFKEA